MKGAVFFLGAREKYLGTTPHPVTATTRITPFLVGNPYKPSFVTVTGWGVDLRNTIRNHKTNPIHWNREKSSRHWNHPKIKDRNHSQRLPLLGLVEKIFRPLRTDVCIPELLVMLGCDLLRRDFFHPVYTY